jgi:hypothetical protein
MTTETQVRTQARAIGLDDWQTGEVERLRVEVRQYEIQCVISDALSEMTLDKEADRFPAVIKRAAAMIERVRAMRQDAANDEGQ